MKLPQSFLSILCVREIPDDGSERILKHRAPAADYGLDKCLPIL